MRKKSHISLAKGLMDSTDNEQVTEHVFTFCVASIWPDCRPSFLTTPHRIDVTFESLKKDIEKLLKKNHSYNKLSTFSTGRLGIILHYIADYFTFPHNKEFSGSLKEHATYERDLKFAIRSYIKDGGALAHYKTSTILYTPDELYKYIERKHSEYVHAIHSLENDIKYIVQVCTDVFVSILTMLGLNVSPSPVLIS